MNFKKIIVIFIFLFILPISVKADSIDRFYMNATVLENGDIEVEEYFYLNGTYSGFDRYIKYKDNSLVDFDSDRQILGPSKISNALDIEIETIQAANILPNFKFELVNGMDFIETNNYLGRYGSYNVLDMNGTKRYRIAISSDNNKAFYLKYLLKNKAILHNDVAEIYWNIFDEKIEKINNLSITIKIPSNTTLELWTKGNYKGVVKKVNNNKIIANITDFNDILTLRFVFDKEVIKNTSKITNANVLDKIYAYEEKNIVPDLNQDENISRYIDQCEVDKTFKCYNELIFLISNDEDLKLKYEDRINNLYDLVIINQKKIVKEKMDKLLSKKYPLYKDYLSVLESVRLLPNDDLSNEYLNNLAELKKEIDSNEQFINDLNMVLSLGIGYILILVLIIFYFNYQRKYKIKDISYTNIPNKYSPIIVDYLLRGRITSKSIESLLHSLINKKHISYKKITNDYIIESKKSRSKLTSDEKLFKELLFNNKNSITLKEFKNDCHEEIDLYNYFNQIKNNNIKYLLTHELMMIDNKTNKFSRFNFLLILLIIILVSLSFFYPILLLYLPFIIVVIVHELNEFDSKLTIKKVLNIIYILVISISIITSINILLICNNNYSIIYNYILVLLCTCFKIFTYNIKHYLKNGLTETEKWLNFKNNNKDKYSEYMVIMINNNDEISYISKKIFKSIILSSNGLDFKDI